MCSIFIEISLLNEAHVCTFYCSQDLSAHACRTVFKNFLILNQQSVHLITRRTDKALALSNSLSEGTP